MAGDAASSCAPPELALWGRQVPFTRHRLASVLAGVAFILLTSAAVALALLYVRAENERVQAEQARAQAETKIRGSALAIALRSVRRL